MNDQPENDPPENGPPDATPDSETPEPPRRSSTQGSSGSGSSAQGPSASGPSRMSSAMRFGLIMTVAWVLYVVVVSRGDFDHPIFDYALTVPLIGWFAGGLSALIFRR